MPRAKSKPQPTPRSELLALLDGARAEPDEDAPRLVLADWLEEQPDIADRDRGEFVRAQVLLHRAEMNDRRCLAAHDLYHGYPTLSGSGIAVKHMSEALFAERSDLAALHGRASQLREQHESAWRGSLPKSDSIDFRRGLMALAYPGGQFPNVSLAKVARTEVGAWAESLTINHLDADATLVAECELLGRLGEVVLANCSISQQVAKSLLETGYFAGVPRITLHQPSFDDGILLALLESLPGLCEVRFGGSVRSETALAGFGTFTGPIQLETLELDGGRADAVLSAFSGPRWPRLRWLLLTDVRLRAADLAALLNTGNLDGLIGLDLFRSEIGSEGLRVLLDWPGLAQIRFLGLGRNNLTTPDALALAQCASLNETTFINLGGNDIGNVGAEAIARSPYLRRLGGIYLWGNGLDETFARVMLDRQSFPGLGFFHASGSNFNSSLVSERFRQLVD